jgi:hypothetical protein
MNKLRPSTKAWIGLGAYVAAYDILAPKGETLSEGVDRALEHDTCRYVTLGGIALTALHLSNLLPQKIDPFHKSLLWRDNRV